MTDSIVSELNAELFGVWFLIGAILVFWMQAGFTMVEAGFSRAKNTGNIIMKNLMDFCIGTVMFILIGFSFLLGEDIAVGSWTAVTITISFTIIKLLTGLRVTEDEEISGLDASEHGLLSAYAGFSLMDMASSSELENVAIGSENYTEATQTQIEASVPVTANISMAPGAIHKIVIITKLARYDKLRKAMSAVGVTGMTVTQVMGCGIERGAGEKYRGVEIDATLLPKVKVEVVVGSIPIDKVIDAAKKTLYTGHVGDGKIFVYAVDRVVKIRTGEEDIAALKDIE